MIPRPMLPDIKSVLTIHRKLIERFGGAPGVRNQPALEGILSGASQTFAGEMLYPTTIDQAVYLCEQVIRQHPFVDGNKRVAAALLGATLSVNGYELIISADDLFTAICDLVTGNIETAKFKSLIASNLLSSTQG